MKINMASLVDIPEPNYSAPDSSEIRLLIRSIRSSMDHMIFKPGKISRAGFHRTVEEKWYVIEGIGKLWLKNESDERIIELFPGVAVQVDPGIKLQFRNNGSFDLKCLLICTPAWPGDSEWEPTEGYW